MAFCQKGAASSTQTIRFVHSSAATMPYDSGSALPIPRKYACEDDNYLPVPKAHAPGDGVDDGRTTTMTVPRQRAHDNSPVPAMMPYLVSSPFPAPRNHGTLPAGITVPSL